MLLYFTLKAAFVAVLTGLLVYSWHKAVFAINRWGTFYGRSTLLCVVKPFAVMGFFVGTGAIYLALLLLVF